MELNENLLSDLKNCVGDAHVLLGSDISARATHFWNSAPRKAGAIIRPANTDEVSKVLLLCHQARQCVVTHGGLTGLVDGDQTTESDLVLSLERMRQIESTDSVGKTMTVQAGCILESVQNEAAANHLSFGMDLGARGSCTIGGNIATNAGGLSVLRYGMMREQILGLEVVLMDGTVLSSMNGLIKNNAGHDLKQLFIGTEGTLGVITRAVLRLRASTTSSNTTMLACKNFDDVTHILRRLDEELSGRLNAFEVLWKPVVELNTTPSTHGAVPAPFDLNEMYYVISESRGANAASDTQVFEQTLQTCFDEGWASDGVIAQSAQEQANIWAIRENIEPMLAHEPNYVFDISLPIATMDNFVKRLHARLLEEWPDTKLFCYGHVADGNLHLIIAPPAAEPAANQAQKINQLVYEPLESIGGSISAEHGIGLSKKPWLHYSRNDSEIRVMQSLKHLFDPHNLLNRGRIVDSC